MLAGVGRGGVMWSLIRPSLISHRLAGHPALHARDLFIFSVNAKATHTLARIRSPRSSESGCLLS